MAGMPKGVLVEHHGLSNLMNWYRKHYDLKPSDSTGQIAGPGFDAVCGHNYTGHTYTGQIAGPGFDAVPQLYRP